MKQLPQSTSSSSSSILPSLSSSSHDRLQSIELLNELSNDILNSINILINRILNEQIIIPGIIIMYSDMIDYHND